MHQGITLTSLVCLIDPAHLLNVPTYLSLKVLQNMLDVIQLCCHGDTSVHAKLAIYSIQYNLFQN